MNSGPRGLLALDLLGVTSPQGRILFPEEGMKRAKTLQEEIALMKRFIVERKITWPVVLTEQSVFNVEYGVEGIPAYIILDAEGRVRDRNAWLGDPLEKTAARIDPLLTEAGKATPPSPASGQSD